MVDFIWIGSTAAQIYMNSVGFTEYRYNPGTVKFQLDHFIQVNQFGVW